MATDPASPDRSAEERLWEEHSLSQLRHFRSLSLQEKMKAVEGMADVIRHFAEVRARGGFVSARHARAEPAPGAHEPPAPPYDKDK